MVGGVRYAFTGLVGIDGGGGVDFGGDAWQGPNDGIGLILVLGVMVGKRLVDIAVSFEIVCRTYCKTGSYYNYLRLAYVLHLPYLHRLAFV